MAVVLYEKAPESGPFGARALPRRHMYSPLAAANDTRPGSRMSTTDALDMYVAARTATASQLALVRA